MEKVSLDFTVVAGMECQKCDETLIISTNGKRTVYAKEIKYCPTCGTITEIICHKCGFVNKFADKGI